MMLMWLCLYRYDRKLVIYEVASLSGDKDLPLKTVFV